MEADCREASRAGQQPGPRESPGPSFPPWAGTVCEPAARRAGEWRGAEAAEALEESRFIRNRAVEELEIKKLQDWREPLIPLTFTLDKVLICSSQLFSDFEQKKFSGLQRDTGSMWKD